MRQNLLRTDIELVNYVIKEIDVVSDILESKSGVVMIKENIGDPVGGGEPVSSWLKEIVQNCASSDDTYAYTGSQGDLDAREYVLKHFSSEKVCTVDDILFFNGLGEAINKIFSSLPRNSRILLPSPVYPAYAAAETLHSGCSYLSYSLDPNNNWIPNLQEIENKVRYNDLIVAIVVINPNNPTGASYDKKTLLEIIKIAKKYNCFLIFDEIYHNLYFDEKKHIYLYDIVGDTPAISMKGISKDMPWPGSRCGWLEIYNVEKDKNFRGFVDTIILIKMLEVCSTTLPQKVLPHIYGNENYKSFLKKRLDKYKQRADCAYDIFKVIPNVRVIKPSSVFYFVVELLELPFSKISSINKEVRLYLDSFDNNTINPDVRFSYELMGAKNICVVPLSTFGTSLTGFRMTLLQEDNDMFIDILYRIKSAIYEYYNYKYSIDNKTKESYNI